MFLERALGTKGKTEKALAIPSPQALLVRMLAAIFVAEAVVMAVLPHLVPHGSGLVAALVDSALLSVMCSLLLWPIAGKHLHSIAVGKKGIADIVLARAVDGILTANERGVITAFNPAAERIFGYRAAEVMGRNVSMLIPEPDRSAHDRYLKDYLRGNRSSAVGGPRRVVGQRRDGSLVPLEISIGETRIGEHRIFTALLRDVSELEKRHAEQLHAQKLEAVGQLAAGIAHEINTPIQYIGDNTRFLQDAFEALRKVVQEYGAAMEVAFSGGGPPAWPTRKRSPARRTSNFCSRKYLTRSSSRSKESRA